MTNCTQYRYMREVFVPFFLLWLIALGLWVHNTWVRNRASANNLHKLLTWLPLVEAFYTFLCIFYYGACPWESFGEQLVAAALLMVVILKEPLNLLCLLLVAKGWHITRDSLHHGENRVVIVSVILLYSAVVFQLFGSTVLWMLPILIAYVIMFVNIIFSIFTNMRILKAQLLAMGLLSIDPATTPAYAKYLMFQRLALATAAYVCLELLIHLSTSLAKDSNGNGVPLWIFSLLHQSMELGCAIYIGLTFRARQLSFVFQQMQDFGLQLAEQLLPSVTSVSISSLEISAPGMVEWSDKMQEPPDAAAATLIVVNPGGEGSDHVQTAVCTDARRWADSQASRHPARAPVAGSAYGAAATPELERAGSSEVTAAPSDARGSPVRTQLHAQQL
ncbi:hypothetical protein T492DRAFT_162757 [Pavlovales sp. CCMP2436]|nr:hypothetical protein T492DRAFT_162757 [Pavlovales sp. CCMP2436]